MIIFEVTKPGTWLQGIEDSQVKRDVEALLDLLLQCLADAAVSLSLFETARAQYPRPGAFTEEQRRKESAQVQRHLDRLLRDLPPGLDGADRFDARNRLSDLARVEAKKQRWLDGEVPMAYRSRLSVIHAKSCLYAFDTLQKTLGLLQKMPGAPTEIAEAVSDFEAGFPGLVHVRDSAHHAEDRAQGKRRKSRIDLQPVSNDLINAPSGGALIHNVFIGNRFGSTLGDGSYGEVEISAESVGRCQSVVQSVYDSYQWSGPTEHKPSS
ncbi:hypothetical protein QFZ79_002727 [Arthrobacter sp. V4I6]|uniref:hypothetical protein n=1 Tax=unclassified Arthrobacter TaxID=235627 RepID=UPI00278197F6|nr:MULTISPECIES: hypothetical protein [unclassified Arthrobacter]MDQ0820435.1 hypothetical protein [Arthrobacter sp. V1I7]MDQ0854616.1 hypothetical protein [Arthrobacter sp. V4I6]